jgi:ATP-binding cassette subfamily C protein
VDIVAAAKLAGIHKMIAGLPEGYGSMVGEGGMRLSAGQRQRIGLARAIFGDPFLLVLDEPNSNLAQDGERALTEALIEMRKRGSIVIVIAHRTSALAAVNNVLVIQNGKQAEFGHRDAVLGNVSVLPVASEKEVVRHAV